MRRLRHLLLMGLLLATTAAFAQTPTRDRPALLRELVTGLGEKGSLAGANTWLGNQVFSSWIAYKPASFSITPNTVQVGTNTVLLGRLASGVVGLYYNDNGTVRDLLAEKLDGTAFSGYVATQGGIDNAQSANIANNTSAISSNATAIATKPTALTAATYAAAQSLTATLPAGVAAIVRVAADESTDNAGTGTGGVNPITYYLYFPGVGLVQLLYYPTNQ